MELYPDEKAELSESQRESIPWRRETRPARFSPTHNPAAHPA